jgi:hypothetical protein
MYSSERLAVDGKPGYFGFHSTLKATPMPQTKPLPFCSLMHRDGPKDLTVSDCLGLFSVLAQSAVDMVEERSPARRKSFATDCQSALAQLQDALLQAHARRWQLDVDFFDARTELTMPRAP